MNNLTFILIILLILIYMNDRIYINNFQNLENVDTEMIIVTDNQFYYLNIKKPGDKRYEIFKIPLYLIKNFY
jgi:hypothetical protein